MAYRTPARSWESCASSQLLGMASSHAPATMALILKKKKKP